MKKDILLVVGNGFKRFFLVLFCLKSEYKTITNQAVPKKMVSWRVVTFLIGKGQVGNIDISPYYAVVGPYCEDVDPLYAVVGNDFLNLFENRTWIKLL